MFEMKLFPCTHTYGVGWRRKETEKTAYGPPLGARLQKSNIKYNAGSKNINEGEEEETKKAVLATAIPKRHKIKYLKDALSKTSEVVVCL